MLPLEIAFEPPFGHTKGWVSFDYLTEVFFTIDLLFHFNTTVIDEDGNEVMHRSHIALDYVKEYHFWIDLASVVNTHGVKYLINPLIGGT